MAKVRSTMCPDRYEAITTFLNSPSTIRKAARDTSMRRGSSRRRSWGTSSVARTIGPATRCGKNASYTAKSMSRAGAIVPRYTSTT